MADTVENMIFFNWLVFGLISGGSITAQLNALAGGDIPWPYQNISQFIMNIVNLAVITAGVGSFALLLYGGIRYITSAGDKLGTQHAREVITAAIVGLVIVVGSYAIATTLGNVMGFNPVNVTIPEAPRGPGGGGGGQKACDTGDFDCSTITQHKPADSPCYTRWECQSGSPNADSNGCLEVCRDRPACGWSDSVWTRCTTGGAF